MSLANRLSIYILLFTVATFCGIAAVYFKYSAAREERQVGLYASSLVENMVEKLDRRFTDIGWLVEETAPRIVSNSGKPENMMDLIDRMVRSDSLLMGGSVAFRPGFFGNRTDSLFMEYVSWNDENELCRKHLGGVGYDYTRMPWYAEAMKTGKAVWSEPYFDAGGGNELMTTYSLPVKDAGGQVFAVLTADLSLHDIVKEINRLKPIPDSYSFILSQRGTYLAHPDSTLILSKNIYTHAADLQCRQLAFIGREMLHQNKGALRIDLEGRDVLAVYAPILRTGWSIGSICSNKSILAELGSATLMVILILFLGLVALLVFIRLSIVYATRPMVCLTEAANRIASGNLDEALPQLSTRDEMKELQNAFASMQLSLRQQMKELEKTTRSKERIESELHIARRIQMSLVPRIFSPFPEWEGLELHAMLHPAKEVGGDFYDFFIRDGKLFFVIGDVSGKGVPASLFMAITRTLFRIISSGQDSPGTITGKLNDALTKDNDTNMFVTLFIGVLDLHTNRMRYCNAGHNPPLLSSDGTVCLKTVKNNLPVGVIPGFSFEEEETVLPYDDTLLLYTDGLTEAENPGQQLFGEQRMMDEARQHTGESPQQCIAGLYEAVQRFADGAEQSDDLTMLCLRLNVSVKPEEQC